MILKSSIFLSESACLLLPPSLYDAIAIPPEALPSGVCVLLRTLPDAARLCVVQIRVGNL